MPEETLKFTVQTKKTINFLTKVLWKKNIGNFFLNKQYEQLVSMRIIHQGSNFDTLFFFFNINDSNFRAEDSNLFFLFLIVPYMSKIILSQLCLLELILNYIKLSSDFKLIYHPRMCRNHFS